MEYKHNVPHITLIIGNGFDLDLGLPTSYYEFTRSTEWKKMMKGVEPTFVINEENPSLKNELKLASEVSNWYDIEEIIHSFVQRYNRVSPSSQNKIKEEFNSIKEALCAYLTRVTKNFAVYKTKLGFQLLQSFGKNLNKNSIINFNYTNPALIFPDTTTYIHGRLEWNNIILGCDLQETRNEEVNKRLSFMYKYNMHKNANNISRKLMGATSVIFFGHSINEMDFRYFKDFFQNVATDYRLNKSLTFITYDEESEQKLKDNIQSQGISVTSLYNNLYSFDVIHTKDYYDNYEDEIEMFNNLKNEIYTAINLQCQESE